MVAGERNGARMAWAGKMADKLLGKKISPMGIGTWGMGGWLIADRSNDKDDTKSIRIAIDNGINVIDTAEMYGRGHSEEIVGKAIEGYEREELFIVTKVWPTHLDRKGILKAIDGSLRRMNLKYVDLYLVHWPSPIADMKMVMRTMEDLVDNGTARGIGVSNFGVAALEGAMEESKRHGISANEIRYNLLDRSAERDTIPFCEKNRIKVIAYSPLARGKVSGSDALAEIAGRYKKDVVQVSLNYLMKRSLPIPKARGARHIKDIIGAAGWKLSAKDYNKIKNGEPGR